MARHFSPAPVPKNIEKWLYDALTRLQDNAEQNSAATAAIARGEVPDGSGNPLTPDLSQYFYLPGRSGGQLAFGAVEASGLLQLSSTKSTTKGKIYLGSARTTAVDELNNRVGIKTASPSASLHVVGEPAAIPLWRPSSNGGGAGFSPGGGSTPQQVMGEIVADDNTSYISAITNNPSQQVGLTFNQITTNPPVFPSNTAYTWTISMRYMKLLAGSVTFNYAFINQGGTTVKSGTISNPTQNQWTTTSVVLSAAEVAQFVSNPLWTSMSILVNGFTGLSSPFSDTQFRITWMQLSINTGLTVGVDGPVAILQNGGLGTADNTQWKDSSGNIIAGVTLDGNFYAGVTAGLSTTQLLLKARAATDIMALFRGTTSQSGDAWRVQDSTPTTLIAARGIASESAIDITPGAAGRAVFRLIPVGTRPAYIDWGTSNDFGPALGTTSGSPCPGTRLATYVSGIPATNDGYGQDVDDAWVLVDTSTNYTIWTADTTSASRQRARWAANGDLTNSGFIRSSKFTVGTTGLSASTPEVRIEQQQTGTNYVGIRAPGQVASNKTQTLLDLTGLIPTDNGVLSWEDDAVLIDDELVVLA